MNLQAQVQELKKKLAKAPDPVEHAEIRTRSEGLEKLL
jgi:hypothetical protein